MIPQTTTDTTPRCQECGAGMKRSYRYFGGHGNVPVRECEKCGAFELIQPLQQPALRPVTYAGWLR